MRNRFLSLFIILFGLLMSVTAWAVIADTNFKPKQDGQAIPGAKVTIVATEAAPKPATITQTSTRTPAPRPRIHRTHTVSSSTGQVSKKIDAKPGETYQIIVEKNGKTWSSGILTLDQLTSGGDISVSPGLASPANPNTINPIPGLLYVPTGIPGAGPFLVVNGGYASTAPPRVTGGTVVDINNVDHALTFSARNLTGPTVNGFGVYNNFYAEFGYADYRGSSSGSEPVGGNNVGLFYHQRYNGSNGVGLGMAGLNGWTDSHIQRFNAGFGTLIPLVQLDETGNLPVQVFGKIGIQYFNSQTSHSTKETTPSFNGIYSMEQYDIGQNFIAPVFGAHVLVGRNQGFFFDFGGRIAPGYTWANLSSSQHNLCNLCPLAQQDFFLNFNFSERSFAFMANASVGAGYRFNDKAAIRLMGSYNYLNKSYGLNVPYTQSQLPIQSTSSSENSWAVAGGIYLSSDVRLKRDIVKVGRLPDGLNLYRYRYQWSDQLYVGVMAQEVAAIEPDAVARNSFGFLEVNYTRLGTRLQTWDEWVRTKKAASSGIKFL
jgi:Chaperone of endosialidase